MYIYAMSKLARHSAIRDLVSNQDVTSQEELRRRLYRRGHRVTQATLSRDIHELRLVKTPDGYKFPQGEVPDAFLPSIERLIQEFVYEVKAAQNLVVVKTSAGSAQPVSAAIDAEEWDEVVGTIGGDDTILVIARDNGTAERLTNRIRGGAPARAARGREEAGPLQPQWRQCVQRPERGLSATRWQWRISLRKLLLAADEGCRRGRAVSSDAARILARAGARSDQPGFPGDRPERRMAAEEFCEPCRL